MLAPSTKTAETSAAVAPKNDPVRVSVDDPVGGTTDGDTVVSCGAGNGVVTVVGADTGLLPMALAKISVYVYAVFVAAVVSVNAKNGVIEEAIGTPSRKRVTEPSGSPPKDDIGGFGHVINTVPAAPYAAVDTIGGAGATGSVVTM
jgi:hypothetical protein